jgi:hypothetical protein
MHWFWRASIAVVGSFAGVTCVSFAVFRLGGIATLAKWPVALGLRVVGLCMPIALYALVTWLFPAKTGWDRETRCRQCGYILRGISEPRCPECGERI